MNISGLKARWVLDWMGGNYGRAKTYETLLFLENRGGTQRITAAGELEIRLNFIAEKLGTAKSSVSRYLAWLSERGFIAIRRDYRNKASCILFIRVLIRPLKSWLERRWNAAGTGVERYTPDTKNSLDTPVPGSAEPSPIEGIQDDQEFPPEKKEPSPPAPLPPVSAMSMLRGKVAGAKGRLTKSAAERAEKGKTSRPTPTQAAHAWNALLRQWGDAPFDLDGKNLAHVKRTLAHLQPKTLDEFTTRLEPAMEWWFANRQQFPKHKSQPAHPWVLNRYKTGAFTAPVPAPTPIPAPEPVAQPTPEPQKSGNGLMAMFSKPKKKYGKGTPQGEG